ncbi:metallophosphoesterase [Candidatus Contubernalis alkaliaceticus]|uniref:metallophosphoesterase n=1 Tax=Candidatus Contubernalis alkaliaceticus TaxID=338645 RepID=UPI001F4C043A|nr:metallophosphoesterase [Candidatus Contubernalis alkalaceticus]
MVGLTFISYLFYEVNSIAVTKYVVPIKNLPLSFDGFTILHLTDLHSKEYGNNQKRLINLINQHEFDMVAITGDVIDKDNPAVMPTINLIRGLPQKPIFFVPGNHEWRTNYTIKEPLLAEGIQILENSNEKFIKGDNHLWIIGVDDPYLEKDDLDKALEGTHDSSPRLLLAHAPNIYSSAIHSNVDLVMAGHTHGGQVRLPFVGAIIAPGQGLFPKLDYGMFQSKATTMIINGGLGESVLPVRFNNRPEILLITLERKSE